MSPAAGLDTFAAAWVDRWLANGGSVILDSSGRSWLHCVASADDVLGYEPPPADWPEWRKTNRTQFDDYMLCGRQRELMDLLETVPGGRDAVKEHVRRFPSRAYGDGSRELS